MNNYQLYSTNVLLGGLVCWDITLKEEMNNLFINDFHVTPINHSIPYSYQEGAYELNYDHQYNISKLYKIISGNFFSGYIDPHLQHDYPIISEEKFNTHCNTYELGCSRTPIQTYGKQLEILCPVWLEHLAENQTLGFDIILNNDNATVFNKTEIVFDQKLFKSVHNDFVKYFKNFIKYTEIDKGNDRVLKINLSDKTAYISGILLNSGNFITSQHNSLTRNILSRERPMMETDSMITNSFKNKNMISSQLFNFRFHFDVNDILLSYIVSKSLWAKFSIQIKVKLITTDEKGNKTEEYLPMRDLFSNYEYTKRESSNKLYSVEVGGNPNVFDYLLDNKCVQLLNINKLYPSIIHWSLNNNNDYIFNVYEGFSGYSIHENFKTGGNSLINHKHIYGKSFNPSNNKYEPSMNNMGWCNNFWLNDKSTGDLVGNRIKYNSLNSMSFDELERSYKVLYNKVATVFGKVDSPWCNDTKYDFNKCYTPGLGEIHVLSCRIFDGNPDRNVELMNLFYNLFTQPGSYGTLVNLNNTQIKIKDSQSHLTTVDINNSNINDIIFLYEPFVNNPDSTVSGKKFIIFISANPDLLTYKGIMQILLSYILRTTDASIIGMFYNMLKLIVLPPIVVFNKSLSIKLASSPSLASTEIEYYKNDDHIKRYLLRYDGKIKPTFLTAEDSLLDNLFYYKLIFSHDELLKNPNYTKYLQMKYPPVFPSIDYFPIKHNLMNYNVPYEYINTPEYKWYNNSSILYLPNHLEISFRINKGSGEHVEIEEFETTLFTQLKNSYNLSNELLKYIKINYNYNIYKLEFHDVMEDNIKKKQITYYIKLILK